MQRIIESTSFFLLVAVTVLRPLIPETYDSAESAITAALDPVRDPTPIRTLVFDMLILLGSCGWLLARAIGPVRRYRRTGIEWGVAIIALAAAISCLAAGNKRLALNATLDWLCCPILAIVLVQLLRDTFRRRVLVAAVLASACVQVSQCFDQYFVSFNDTWQHYESIRADFWASQGVELDSAKVELFENRIKAKEASGFLPHSNVAGSYLLLCGLTAVGVVLAACRRGRETVAWFLVTASTIATALVFLAVPLTKSLGAIASGIAGVVLWVGLRLISPWIASHRTKSLIAGWGLAALGLGTVVGHGLYHGSFPHMSLNFRWWYWQASSGLIADHAMTGVGRENFGRHFLEYKPIDCPEEIANPHNLFVQAAADWGLLGLTGIIVMMVGASIALTRAAPRPSADEEADVGPATRSKMLPWMLGLGLVVTAGRLPLLGTDDPNFLYASTVITAIAWLIGFALFSWDTLGRLSAEPCKERPLGMAVAVGLFTFVLHDMVNFAMFVPATATTAFALLALGIAGRSSAEPPQEASRQSRGWLPFAVTSGVFVLVAVCVTRPAIIANWQLTIARKTRVPLRLGAIADQLAFRHYQTAVDADVLDPTAPSDTARWLIAISSIPEFNAEALPLAEKLLQLAVKRDPFKVAHPRLLVRLHQAWAESSGDPSQYLKAVAAAESVLELYPEDPSGIVTLADCQAAAGETTKSAELLREAVSNYERALSLDNDRLEWETIRAFRDREEEEIREKIKAANHLRASLRG
ncbi:MAG: O-antigen ligase family protein [Phycisphaerales bacterium]|nr:MAG: O-antigen ligase family protein [Phycisphaerales bacterium]